MTSHRSWFPYILAGLTVLLTAVFLVVEQRLERRERALGGEPAFTQEPAVTDAAYVAAATIVLETYAANGDANAAYEALILLRVPPSDQRAHFDLVAAFGKLLAGDEDDAAARFAALKAQYSWMPL